MQRHKLIAVIVGFAITKSAYAAELIYTPVNPSFGGSPFNGAPLLSNAQSQNEHTEAAGDSNSTQNFEEQVDRLVLNQISRDILRSITNDTGDLVPGTINTGINTIVIMDDTIGALDVSITNNATGETTTISIPQF